MTKPRHVKWLLFLVLLMTASTYSFGQSATVVKYRWSASNAKLSEEFSKDYAHLKEVTYTSPRNLEQWSAKDALEKFAKSFNGGLQAQYMLLIDDEGVITEVKVLRSTDSSKADTLKAMLLKSKTDAISFDHNTAVACHVPVSIKIEGNRVTLN